MFSSNHFRWGLAEAVRSAGAPDPGSRQAESSSIINGPEGVETATKRHGLLRQMRRGMGVLEPRNVDDDITF